MKLETLATNIQTAMTANGINQKQLAKLTGLAPMTVNKCVRGIGLPTAYSLYKISEAVGVSMDGLVSGKKGVTDEIKARFCDEYCKYPYECGQEELDGICVNCLLNEV